MESAFLAGLLLLIVSFYLFEKKFRKKILISIFCCIGFFILICGIVFENASLKPLEGELIYYKESKFERIEVHKNNEQVTLFNDGDPVISSQDTMTTEQIIHYPMSQADNPKQVLIIAGISNMEKELQKYKNLAVDYIELDQELANALFQFKLIQKFSLLNVICHDAKLFLKTTKKQYDVIILNIPDPSTFQTNRFFTLEFFSLIKSHLSKNGIFSFSMQGFENYITEINKQKLSTLYNSAKSQFKKILILPGNYIFFLCSDISLQTDIPALLYEKGITTDYIEGLFYGNITQQRIQYINKVVDPTISKNFAFYSNFIKLIFSQWFLKFSTSPTIFIIILILFVFIYFIFITKEEFLLFSTGFMLMGSEIFLIFTFQIFFGYIYFKIGFIITSVLLGLLPGAWIGSKLIKKAKTNLIYTDCALILLILFLLTIIQIVKDSIPSVFFFIFGFLISLVCGSQFPLASKLQKNQNIGAIKLFSADLIGAAFGSLIISIVMIPYFGILWAANLLIKYQDRNNFRFNGLLKIDKAL